MNSTGRRNHSIPSSLIARFSPGVGPARERLVHKLERGGNGRPVQMTAGSVCAEIDRYFLKLDPEREKVDRVWAYYEDRLGGALDELSSPRGKSIASLRWLTVLVPFVAALLVRSSDFERRYRTRADDPDSPGRYSVASRSDHVGRFGEDPLVARRLEPDAGDESERMDNMNVARLAEMQRLLMPVATARWVVLHTPEDAEPFILPDSGYVPGGPKGVENCVLTIPIGPQTALTLAHSWWRTVADGTSGQWRTTIEHADVSERFPEIFNAEAAKSCEHLVLGGSPTAVAPLAAAMAKQAEPSADCLWLSLIERASLCAMELDWFKLVTSLARYRPGDTRIADFERDPAVLRRYATMVMFTADRPMLDHIALATDEGNCVIYSCMPVGVDLSHPKHVKVTYAEGSPNAAIRGVVADPDQLPFAQPNEQTDR